MTYHSPGMARSSSRNAATGSTSAAASLGVLGRPRRSSVAPRRRVLGGLGLVRRGLGGVLGLDGLPRRRRRRLDPRPWRPSTASPSSAVVAPRRARSASYRFGSDTVAASSWTSRGGTCERRRHRRRPPRDQPKTYLTSWLEPVVEHGHETDHDDDEDHHHGGVGHQLVARRPDDLAQLGDDLAVEQRDPAPAGPSCRACRRFVAPSSRDRRRPRRQACRWSPRLPSLVLT